MQWGYLQKTRTKRRGFLKLLADCQKILAVLEEDGPSKYGKLREKTSIPKGTIDRRLWFLRDLHLIFNENRKWMLLAHARTYKNLEEYEIHLKHSKELVKGLLAIYQDVPQIPPLTNILTEEQREKFGLDIAPELLPYALQHLRTAYPDIFITFEQFNIVMNKIATKLSDEESGFLDKLEEETSTGRPHERLLRNEKMKKLQKLEQERFEIMDQLDDKIIELILKVIHGEPLKGLCTLCPSVKISNT